MFTTTQFIIAVLVLVALLYVYMFKHGVSLKKIFSTVFDFKETFVVIRKQLTNLGDKLDGIKDGKFTPDTIISSFTSRLKEYLDPQITSIKEQLVKIGDKLDGVEDGKFDKDAAIAAIEKSVVAQVKGALKDVSEATSNAIQTAVKAAIDAQLGDLKKSIADQIAKEVAGALKTQSIESDKEQPILPETKSAQDQEPAKAPAKPARATRGTKKK